MLPGLLQTTQTQDLYMICRDLLLIILSILPWILSRSVIVRNLITQSEFSQKTFLIHAMSHLSMLFSAKVFKVIVWTCTASILLLSGLRYWLQSIWDWLILCEIHVQLFLVLFIQKVSQYLRGGKAN